MSNQKAVKKCCYTLSIVQSRCLVDVLGDDFGEMPSMELGTLDLKLAGLTGSVSCSQSGGAVGGSTENFSHVHNVLVLVADRDVDDTLMSQVRNGRQDCRFLTSMLRCGTDDNGSHFTVESLRGPELTGRVEEGRDLSDGAAVTRWESEYKGIVFRKISWFDDWDILVLGGCVHFCENFSGERLGELEQGWCSALFLDAFDGGVGHLLDMAIHRIVDDGDLWRFGHFEYRGWVEDEKLGDEQRGDKVWSQSLVDDAWAFMVLMVTLSVSTH